MVSKNQIKWITSLQQKKFRKQYNLFIAEGEKVIQECIDSQFVIEYLCKTTDSVFNSIDYSFEIISIDEMKKISCLASPSNSLAVFKIPEEKPIDTSGLILVLDDIRDPGNLGAIIRLCDWFGISQIVCSLETVDFYNPKVIMASMGSFSRVSISYVNLELFLQNTKKPIYGTFMEGKSIYNSTLNTDAILVFGNEANGISDKIEKIVSDKICIPRFGTLQKTESLNVATAAAIFLSEFKRKS